MVASTPSGYCCRVFILKRPSAKQQYGLPCSSSRQRPMHNSRFLPYTASENI